MPSSGSPVAGSAGRAKDWRRASTTWIASPAAIASLATSTAWIYASRPRLVWTGPSRPEGGDPLRVDAAPFGEADPLDGPDPLPETSAPAPAGRGRLPFIFARLGREVRSSAAKIASSAIR